MRIADKEAMYRELSRGTFGNTLRTWPTMPPEAEYGGAIGLRYKGSSGRRWFRMNLSRAEADETVELWLAEGAEREHIVWCEQPASPLVVNLEVGWRDGDPPGLLLRYNTHPALSCREAMLVPDAVELQGVRARALLRSWLWPSSFDDVDELLERFPQHIVEVSVFRSRVGPARGRNHVVWEVRDY